MLIVREGRKLMTGLNDSAEHGDLLYDEWGLPK
jgi:hypothetical protein